MARRRGNTFNKKVIGAMRSTAECVRQGRAMPAYVKMGTILTG